MKGGIEVEGGGWREGDVREGGRVVFLGHRVEGLRKKGLTFVSSDR